MLGQMQEWPLVVSTIIDHAARHHGGRRLFGRSAEGPIVESDWASVRREALRVSAALRGLGVRPGDRIGVMAWNTLRHLAVWYGVPGAGAVNHTLNPRLFDAQLIYIINHAEDRWIFCDADLAPIIARIQDRLTTVEGVVILTDQAHMPSDAPAGALCYADLIAAQSEDQGWTAVDERAACGMCYTSGTTGDPKGVAYSHRSNVLHAMSTLQPDILGLSASSVVMPVVPLFHANGWSTGYSTPMAGAGMAMPGRDLTPGALYELLERGVTLTLGVPTVWLALLEHLRETGRRLSTLKRVVIGGSACPHAMLEEFEDVHGVEVAHAWGMTETSPLGAFATLTPELSDADPSVRRAQKLKVGRAFYTVDFKIGAKSSAASTDGDAESRWDGETTGPLLVRGPGVLQRYVKHDRDALDEGGWFDTGDVASIDAHGFAQITDRAKDVIKSGGEWISSIELENIAVGHPDVVEAAVIGVSHPKWRERPLLIVVPKPGCEVDASDVLAHVGAQVASWQAPDDVLVVAEIPHTATGKISKRTLREHIAAIGYRHPEARDG